MGLQIKAWLASGGPPPHPERTPAALGGWVTGYGPAFGARPLRRLVQREIGDRLHAASSPALSTTATP